MFIMTKFAMWILEYFDIKPCKICGTSLCFGHPRHPKRNKRKPKVKFSPPPRRRKSNRHSAQFEMIDLNSDSEIEIVNRMSMNRGNNNDSKVWFLTLPWGLSHIDSNIFDSNTLNSSTCTLNSIVCQQMCDKNT